MVRYGMHPSSERTELGSPLERRTSFRTSCVDGRRARLVVRDGTLPVRILDESAGGFRIVATEACALPDQTRTVLQVDDRDVAVWIVYKRLEGPRTMLGLARLPS